MNGQATELTARHYGETEPFMFFDDDDPYVDLREDGELGSILRQIRQHGSIEPLPLGAAPARAYSAPATDSHVDRILVEYETLEAARERARTDPSLTRDERERLMKSGYALIGYRDEARAV